jgi:hypothetical protein
VPKLKHSLFVIHTEQVDYLSFETARIPDSFGGRAGRPFFTEHGFTHFKTERRSRTVVRADFPKLLYRPISKSAELGHRKGQEARDAADFEMLHS